MALSNRTIQGAIDLGNTITVYCHRPSCNHRAELDLIKLRDRLGPDHGALHDDLAPKLRCSKCGGKDVGMISSPQGDGSRMVYGAYTWKRDA